MISNITLCFSSSFVLSHNVVFCVVRLAVFMAVVVSCVCTWNVCGQRPWLESLSLTVVECGWTVTLVSHIAVFIPACNHHPRLRTECLHCGYAFAVCDGSERNISFSPNENAGVSAGSIKSSYFYAEMWLIKMSLKIQAKVFGKEQKDSIGQKKMLRAKNIFLSK